MPLKLLLEPLGTIISNGLFHSFKENGVFLLKKEAWAFFSETLINFCMSYLILELRLLIL